MGPWPTTPVVLVRNEGGQFGTNRERRKKKERKNEDNKDKNIGKIDAVMQMRLC